LLDAVVAISSDLDMRQVLGSIVGSACELTGARFGALGIVGEDGMLSEFIPHGLTDAEVARTGAPPRGNGILGELIKHPTPLRLSSLTEHPESSGFPANHPPMTQFLGVPVRIRGTVFGNLYLTDKLDGTDFTELDQSLLEALATAAGFVIDNARAYALSERQREWLEVTAALNNNLHPPMALGDALGHIAVAVRTVSRASAVAVVRSDAREHQVVATDGRHVERLPALVESLGASETTTRVTELRAGGVSGRAVELVTHVPGIFHVVMAEEVVDERELVVSLIEQAGLTLDRIQALEDREQLALVSDRERIARDLHDVVIQRLFATGLSLNRLVGTNTRLDEASAARIETAILDLDTTIAEIRTTIHELNNAGEGGVRHSVSSLAREYADVLGFAPSVRVRGPLDAVASERVARNLLRVMREALSNAARHAHASKVILEIDASPEAVELRVTDNGVGLPPERHESGLGNLRTRAIRLGGSLEIMPGPKSGTRLIWRVPADA
jgi:signal transduction histidine kinase